MSTRRDTRLPDIRHLLKAGDHEAAVQRIAVAWERAAMRVQREGERRGRVSNATRAAEVRAAKRVRILDHIIGNM